MEMDSNLAQILTTYYFGIVGFIIGWAMPRGRALKYIQIKFIQGLHAFFTDEEEYVAKKVNRVRGSKKGK